MFAAALSLGVAQAGTLAVAGGDGNPALLPTGQFVTPTLAPGSHYQRLSTGLRPDGNADADSAMASAVSPDGRTLLVLTSGFNCCTNFEDGNHGAIDFPAIDPITGAPSLAAANAGQYNGANQAEFVFIYDLYGGRAVKYQKLPIPDTYNGIAWDPAGQKFYVSGGIDDRILIYKNTRPKVGIAYERDLPYVILKHNKNDALPVPLYKGSSLGQAPVAFGPFAPLIVGTAAAPQQGIALAATVAGFDLSRDGKTLVAANFHNASATIVDTATRTVEKEIVFTPPGSTVPIGEMPFWVSVKSGPTGTYQKAYITSQRDDQVVVLKGNAYAGFIRVPSGPSKSVLDPTGRYLYVACGNDDSVAVIDTTTDAYIGKIPVSHAGDPYKGAIPNSVAISPNGKRLYVTLGGFNAVAVVDIPSGSLLGYIPTAWLPTSVSVSGDGKTLYVVNEKSNAGPNPGNLYYSPTPFLPYAVASNPTLRNEYTWELEKSGLTTIPVPDSTSLSTLTRQVDTNNNFQNRYADPLKPLRGIITHVIYIVNENRTFDQVLGDLGNGSNGQPKLTFFPWAVTPNLHALAKDFVTLDNFYDSSETSGVGWNWVMQGHTNDYVEKTQPVDYGNGGYGFSYDWQGIVDNVNLGLPSVGPPNIFKTRITGVLDPSGASTILPGYKDPSATEGADDLSPGTIGGYIWESVLRRYGKDSVRNYGWQIDLNMYSYPLGPPLNPPPLIRNPFATGTVESEPSTPSIRPVTDRYYRAFDQSYPDIYRVEEWSREFANYVKNDNLPQLEVMTIPHDHTGNFGTPGSIATGLTTPRLELADHDYAIGKLVEAVSHSKYWKSTAIIMLEDDPQNGQDHVEAHRSIIHIISPYTQHVGVIHSTYFSTSALRTVEDLLGVQHLGFNDANASPISEAFRVTPDAQPYTATIPGSLCMSPVSPTLVPACKESGVARTAVLPDLHDGAWWADATSGLDFSKPDHVNPQYYNAIVQYGITGEGSMPQKTGVALTSRNYDRGDADGDGN